MLEKFIWNPFGLQPLSLVGEEGMISLASIWWRVGQDTGQTEEEGGGGKKMGRLRSGVQ